KEAPAGLRGGARSAQAKAAGARGSDPSRARDVLTGRPSGPSAHLASAKTLLTTELASRDERRGLESGHSKSGRGPTASVTDRSRTPRIFFRPSVPSCEQNCGSEIGHSKSGRADGDRRRRPPIGLLMDLRDPTPWRCAGLNCPSFIS